MYIKKHTDNWNQVWKYEYYIIIHIRFHSVKISLEKNIIYTKWTSKQNVSVGDDSACLDVGKYCQYTSEPCLFYRYNSACLDVGGNCQYTSEPCLLSDQGCVPVHLIGCAVFVVSQVLSYKQCYKTVYLLKDFKQP